MTIEWLGHHCCLVETKGASVVINPWPIKIGKMSRLDADILVVPEQRSEGDLAFTKTPALVVNMPGEFEDKEVLVEGRAVVGQPSLLFRVYLDGISVGYVGGLVKQSDDLVSFLEDVDVLLIAVDGGEGLTPAQAAEVVSSIEPRLVIPLATVGGNAEKFAQAVGVKSPERLKKLNVTRKDLPNEDTRLAILES